MEQVGILLNSRDKLRQFHAIVSRYDGAFELRAGCYTADGKSLLDICTLDLMRTLTLVIRASAEDMPKILQEIAPYRVPLNREERESQIW